MGPREAKQMGTEGEGCGVFQEEEEDEQNIQRSPVRVQAPARPPFMVSRTKTDEQGRFSVQSLQHSSCLLVYI